MVEDADHTADLDDGEPVEPMLIRAQEVLGIFDRVLRREDEIGEAYVFAIDVIESIADGTGALEDPAMRAPLEELANASVVNYDIVEQIRGRLGLGKDSGNA